MNAAISAVASFKPLPYISDATYEKPSQKADEACTKLLTTSTTEDHEPIGSISIWRFCEKAKGSE